MSSMKLLVAMAVLAAFVAGPVLAQEEAAPASGDAAMSSDQGMAKTTTPSKGKHHKSSKHHKKSKHGAGSAMPSTTTGQ